MFISCPSTRGKIAHMKENFNCPRISLIFYQNIWLIEAFWPKSKIKIVLSFKILKNQFCKYKSADAPLRQPLAEPALQGGLPGLLLPVLVDWNDFKKYLLYW